MGVIFTIQPIRVLLANLHMVLSRYDFLQVSPASMHA